MGRVGSGHMELASMEIVMAARVNRWVELAYVRLRTTSLPDKLLASINQPCEIWGTPLTEPLSWEMSSFRESTALHRQMNGKEKGKIQYLKRSIP